MDQIKARELETKLRGLQIGEWTIEALVDHGKSAAVFRALGPSGKVAVKIFDDELIAKYGDDTQFARIERELTLIGKFHPNLVRILAGGVDLITKNHFIVMNYLDGPNLKTCLDRIPSENISPLIAQLASAAEFLEEHGYVHRDIKPENIILLENFSKMVLLDLGVIRPLAGSHLTDDGGVQAFIGTLQYSSPEFLLRQEENTVEGWRAVTFYQIGGVLHDLIMRRPLFAEFLHPYARLVNAIQHFTPEIQNSAVEYRLVELARCCLLKNWRNRIRLVAWASFEESKVGNDRDQSLKQRVTVRGELARARLSEATATTPKDELLGRQKLSLEVLDYLSVSARTIRHQNAVLPPVKILPKTPDDNSIGIQFRQSQTSGLGSDLVILVHVEILDVAARVIDVSACGCLGQFEPGEPMGIDLASVFQGTYDGTAVYRAIETCIYDLIDQGQESADGCAPMPRTTWLRPTVRQ
jgi:eukaryotic-like serine/threonine-protein kinase